MLNPIYKIELEKKCMIYNFSLIDWLLFVSKYPACFYLYLSFLLGL